MQDEINIEELYIDYHQDIYHFSLYFTNSVQDAEDITQETFIKAMKNIKSLNDISKAKYWLLSIARHTAIDHLRRKKFKTFIPDLFDKILPYSSMNPTDEHVLAKENWQEVQEALLNLKPHYRSLLILRGIKELTIKETAEVLQCTELKVRVDFHRAVKFLKKELIEMRGDVHTGEKEQNLDSRRG